SADDSHAITSMEEIGKPADVPVLGGVVGRRPETRANVGKVGIAEFAQRYLPIFAASRLYQDRPTDDSALKPATVASRLLRDQHEGFRVEKIGKPANKRLIASIEVGPTKAAGE